MNAIDSTPPGRVVMVTSRAGSDGGQVWTVEDEGGGIPAHLLARIGTPFISRRKGGSGLGVAVARDTVERHGGWLDIRSAPGLGTLVSIHLPRPPGDAGDSRAPAAVGSP
jgi:signal transduction histidine kinase